METREKELPNYRVMSESTGEVFIEYKVDKTINAKPYALIDSSSNIINRFNSLEEADNHANFCAEACALYLRNNSAIDFSAYEKFESQLDDLCVKYNVTNFREYFFNDSSNPEFTSEHGFGPSVSMHATPVYGSAWFKVRYEYLNTEVMFPSAQAAINAMNNFVNIDDWKVYDWKTGTTS